ncbi:hypothetical protein PFHG_03585 [Plasmodium falciparum HB3]|uniref:Uncharacterized protein n=1 Tax=Plasmodium falciparum (isolate HB3) TaxID=137071 RepID=A0A0L7KEX8_PLAFX|nr:hypothetical protein PFHG_03585 [Plasmodium falciparum HB3]
MFGKRKLIDSQEPKKKKKWKEELHDDLDDIDLECLKYVEEDVQEDDVDKNTTTHNNNNDDDINECDNKKSTVYSDLLDEKDKINKDKALNLSDKMELINNIMESKNNSIHNNNITYDILNDINKFSINPVDIKMQDIEHIITYIYFNNIHFNCSIKNFVEFLENNINNKIIQINSDKLTNHTILYKYDEKNNDTVIINKFTHHGKLFVHVKTYEDVVTLLKLNETLFMGRIIKSIQAYRKNDRFFILQAPSQYKYFINLAVHEKNKRKRKG